MKMLEARLGDDMNGIGLGVGKEQHEKSLVDSLEGSNSQIKSECSKSKNSSEARKDSFLMFSRSAELVGNLVADQSTSQRPDRLHARRPSVNRRGGVTEQNQTAAARCVGSKTGHRVLKSAQIRTSKSCTTECEILRAYYAADYSTAYSTIYEDLLRDEEDSNTFSGLGHESQDEQEDVTLSESTALAIDMDDLDVKSDISNSSQDNGLHERRKSLQKGRDTLENSFERPKSSVHRRHKINSSARDSDECLDSENSCSEWGDYRTEEIAEIRNESSQDDKISSSGGSERQSVKKSNGPLRVPSCQLRTSCDGSESEQSSSSIGSLVGAKEKKCQTKLTENASQPAVTFCKNLSLAGSTGLLAKAGKNDLDEPKQGVSCSSSIRPRVDPNKASNDVKLRARASYDTKLQTKASNDSKLQTKASNGTKYRIDFKCHSRQDKEWDSDHEKFSVSREDLGVEFLACHTPPKADFNRKNVQLETNHNEDSRNTEPELLYERSNHERWNKNLKKSAEKRKFNPETLSQAIIAALESGHIPASSLEDDAGAESQYLVRIAHDGEGTYHARNGENLDNFTTSVQEPCSQNGGSDSLRADTPGISILSFGYAPEVPELPSRPEHNDIYHGERLFQVYPSSRSATPSCSNISEHHANEDCFVFDNIDKWPGECTQMRITEEPLQKHRSYESRSVTIMPFPHCCAVEMKGKTGFNNYVLAKSSRHDRCGMPHDAQSACDRLISDYPEEILTHNNQYQPSNIEGRFHILKSQSMEFTNHPMRETNPINLAAANEVKATSGQASRIASQDEPTGIIVRRSLAKFPGSQLGTHEYLPFLDKLRRDAALRKEASHQQSKLNKQRKLAEVTKKNATTLEDEAHADIETLSSAPVCPVGHEVRPDWKPGAHGSHPFTKLSASYNHPRKVKRQRKSIRKKKIAQRKICGRKNIIDFGSSRGAKGKSYNNEDSPQKQASSSTSATRHYDSASSDTDPRQEELGRRCPQNPLRSFEEKINCYDKLSEMVNALDSYGALQSCQGPAPKRITSQVRLLKTLDEFYSPRSSDEGEREMSLNEQSFFDTYHHLSLFNYYTTRLKNLTMIGKVPTSGESTTLPLIRIRKASSEVPSALDNHRLRSLYKNRTRKSSIIAMAKKVVSTDQTKQNDRPYASSKTIKQGQVNKGYNRAASTAPHSPRVTGTNVHAPEISAMYEDIVEVKPHQPASSIDKPLGVWKSFETVQKNGHHLSYLDILKANLKNYSRDTKQITQSASPHPGSITVRKIKPTNAAVLGLGKEPTRASCNEDYTSEKMFPSTESDVTQRNKLKVRFASSLDETNKERLFWDRSDEDTWCSTVNAMLLRADKVMDYSTRNDHRYPKPDSAKVVSPVPPKSPTFLKELLKQDTIERKQAKGFVKAAEKKNKETVVRIDTKECKMNTFPTMQPLTSSDSKLPYNLPPPSNELLIPTISSLVYTLPLQEGSQSTSYKETSAGVLKISIQMSKRAQERAWLTHERLKRQRSTLSENELPIEMKALPKKLAPLRISKPLNFQNLDSRNMERLPMKEIMSKSLEKLPTNAQRLFQPKSTPPDTPSSRGSNFLLDQHSETLHNYRGPYMHQISSSIVPLFSDFNNNAYLRDRTGEQPDSGDMESTCESNLPAQDEIQLYRADHDEFRSETSEAALDNNSLIVYGLKNKMDANGNVTDSEFSYLNQDFFSKRDTPRTLKTTENFDNSKLAKIGDENKVTVGKNLEKSEIPKKFTSQVYKNEADVSSTEKSFEFNENLQRNVRETFQPYYREITAIKTSLSKPGENVSGVSDNRYKFDETSNKIMDDETKENECGADSNKQETLLQALLGYEEEAIERASTNKTNSSYRMMPEQVEFKEDVDVDYTSIDNEFHSPHFYKTCYLQKWVPEYMENQQAAEKQFEQEDPPRKNKEDIKVEDTHTEETVEKQEFVCNPDFDITHLIQMFMDEKTGSSQREEVERTNHHEGVMSIRSKRHLIPSVNSTTKIVYGIQNFAVEGTAMNLSLKTTSSKFYERSQSRERRTPTIQKEKMRSFQSDDRHRNNLLGTKSKSRTSTAEEAEAKATLPVLSTVKNSASSSFPRTSVTASSKEMDYQPTKVEIVTKEYLKNFLKDEDQLNEKSFIDLEEEYCSWSGDNRSFRWEEVQIPPSFKKGRNLFSVRDKKKAGAMEEAVKDGSIYSGSSTTETPKVTSLVSTFKENSLTRLPPLGESNEVQSTHFEECYSRKFPHLEVDGEQESSEFDGSKEGRSPVVKEDNQSLLLNFEENYTGQSPHGDESSVGQTPQFDEDYIALSPLSQLTHRRYLQSENSATTELMTPLSKSLHVLEDDLGVDHPAASPRPTTQNISKDSRTLTQTLGALSEREPYETLFEMPPGNALSSFNTNPCGDYYEMDLLNEPENTSWHKISESLKLEHWRPFKNNLLIGPPVIPPDFHSHKPKNTGTQKAARSNAFDRSFLKTLRHTGLVRTVSLDRKKIFKSLESMTRRQGYLPMFQFKYHKSVEMRPLIVSLHHCAQESIERRSLNSSGSPQVLPVFYTEDETGFLTSLFTVNRITVGVYSLGKTNPDDFCKEDPSDLFCEKANFGKLVQYSPTTSDLAFHSERAFLIGKELNTRELAVKKLIDCQDDARGDVAKYFMCICGWVPTLLLRSSFSPPEDRSFECLAEEKDLSVVKPRFKPTNAEGNLPAVEHRQLIKQLTRFPVITPRVKSNQPEKKAIGIMSGTVMKTLPKIPSESGPLVINALKSRTTLRSFSEQIYHLPEICKSARSVTSNGRDNKCLMLCLRCGVVVDYQQPQIDDGDNLESTYAESKSTFVKNRNSKIPRLSLDHVDCFHNWAISESGLTFPLPTQLIVKKRIKDRSSTARYTPRHAVRTLKQSKPSLERKSQSITHFPKQMVSNVHSGKNKAQSQMYEKQWPEYTTHITIPQAQQYTEDFRQPKAGEKQEKHERPMTDEKHETYFNPASLETTNLSTPSAAPGVKTEGDQPRQMLAVHSSVFTRGMSPGGYLGVVKDKAGMSVKNLPRKQVPKTVVTSPRSQPTLQASNKPTRQKGLQARLSMSQLDKKKSLFADSFVAGWSWNTVRDAGDDEKDLMEKRTWSQAVLPPSFPANVHPVGSKPIKVFQSSKAQFAQHKRNLSKINHSYVSPYWAKKEVKGARSRTPVSNNDDAHSTISKITTISGISSSTSESNTENESSTEESESDSDTSAAGSDFFTRYANKGGPTSIDDIFKRTIPKQQLNYNLNVLKQAKEREVIEQLGYLRGREGAALIPRDHGNNAKEVERDTLDDSDYDMCSDAEEFRELWKQCFPQVDFWERNRRKTFKKRKILF